MHNISQCFKYRIRYLTADFVVVSCPSRTITRATNVRCSSTQRSHNHHYRYEWYETYRRRSRWWWWSGSRRSRWRWKCTDRGTKNWTETIAENFLLESLHEQIHGLEERLDGLKLALKSELPMTRAEEIIKRCMEIRKSIFHYPCHSGFGPVKTLMGPDFCLSKCIFWHHSNALAVWCNWSVFGIIIFLIFVSFNFFLIYYSVGTIWITTKLCHIRFNLTRQSNRIKESRIFRFDWIYVGPSIGTQLSLLKGSQFRSKCGRSDPKGYCRVDTLVCLLNYQADGSPFWNQFLVVALRDAERMSSTMSVYNVRSPRPLWKAYGWTSYQTQGGGQLVGTSLERIYI